VHLDTVGRQDLAGPVGRVDLDAELEKVARERDDAVSVGD
jgi:hypothetical protein